MNRRSGNLPINQPMIPARRPPTAHRPRYIDEHTGPTINPLAAIPSAPTSRFYGYDLTARGREGKPTTMPTRHARRDEPTAPSNVDSYKKGGMVKKTGLAYLHKGEMVIPKKDVKKVKKMLK